MNKPTEKRSSEESKPARRTVLQRSSQPITIIICFLIALLALFAFYHAKQSSVWEGRLNRVSEELDVTKQELENVKDDLRVRVEREVPQTDGHFPGAFQVTVVKSQTARPPSATEDLSITLTDVTFHANPPRYTVTAIVTYKDNALQEMQIRNAGEGYIVTYPKENGYRIELLKVDSVSAKFSITKNP